MEEKRRIRLNIRIGTIFSYLVIFVGIIVTIFYTPFLIKNIGKVQHGIYTFVNSIIHWMSILTVGLAGAFVRFATKYKNEEGEAAVDKVNSAFIFVLLIAAIIGIIVGIILFLLIYFEAIPLQGYSYEEKQLIHYLYIIGLINLTFYFITMFFNAFNTYKNNFILVRGIALGIAILSPIITIPFLLKGYNVISVALVKLFVDFAALLVYLIYSIFFNKIKFAKFENPAERKFIIKEILVFCLYIILFVTVDTLTKSSEKIVLGFKGMPEFVSIYGLGRAFLSYTYMLTVYISANFIQIINEKIMNNKHKEVSDLFIKLSKIGLLMMLFIFGGFLVTGRSFVMAWLGNSSYSEIELTYVYIIVLSLLFANIVPFSQSSAIEIQRGYNKHKVPTLILFIGAIINLIIMVILVNVLPLDYIILGTLLSSVIITIIIQWIILNIYYKKELYLDIKNYFMFFLKHLAITAVPSIICLFVFNVVIDLSKYMAYKYVFLIQGFSYVIIHLLLIFIFERKLILFFFNKFGKKPKTNTESVIKN